MNGKRLLRSLGLTLVIGSLAAFLGACDGGGGDSTSSVDTDSSGDISATSITSTGTITGFGSIILDDRIEFETSSASVTVDSDPGTEADLGLGMVVTVRGTVDESGTMGTAESVEFDDEVQGPIDGIQTLPATDPDSPIKTFTVLGVEVQVDRFATEFEDVTFDTLANGQLVEVSGYVDNDGVIQATRIERKLNETEVELKGVVTNLAATTFTLGTITVDFSGADLSDVPNGTITEGMQVEVEGTFDGATMAITATRVEQEDDLLDDDVDKVSLHGIITDFVSSADFMVLGQPVDASGATLEPTTLILANDVEVEVEGPIVNGVLVAVEVEGEEADDGNIRIEAAVLSVDTVAATITLQLIPADVTVNLTGDTTLRDDTEAVDNLTLGDIAAPDFLEIKASLDAGGNIVAAEIRRDETDDDILQGPVDTCTNTEITILGVSFGLVDGVTEYEDQNDAPVANSAVFCDLVGTSGFAVKVKDDRENRDGIADEAELEDE